ncbi:MAG: 50S ribosomal protein L35, partial [Ktedonobacteraceae bacterium]
MKQKLKLKLRTHSAMSKRVKVTGTGKLMHRKPAGSHLRRNKSSHAIRSMDKTFRLKASDTRRMKRLLPYAF